ncbi:MAG: hypothetical protein M0Q43_07795, partial [Methanothrix sp.]|nr:hypothetical protein [Methanothrix sp.]
PGYGKVKGLADVVSRVSRMVYQDEFTSAQLIELKDQYELQSKIASKSKGDRARQKLNFRGPIDSKTLDGYERSANEIVAAIDDKLTEGQVKAVDIVDEVTAQKATNIILKTMIPVDLYGIRKKLQESGIIKNVMMGSDIVETNIALKTGRVGKLLGTKIVDAANQVGLNISNEIDRITGAQYRSKALVPSQLKEKNGQWIPYQLTGSSPSVLKGQGMWSDGLFTKADDVIAEEMGPAAVEYAKIHGSLPRSARQMYEALGVGVEESDNSAEHNHREVVFHQMIEYFHKNKGQ